MINIVLIKPYDWVTSVVEEVLAEHPNSREISLEMIDSQAKRSVYEGKPLHYRFRKDTDVVIARMYSAQSLIRSGITTVEIPISGYDVVIAINSCIEQYHPKSIAVFSLPNAMKEAEKLIDIFTQKIIFMEIRNPESIPAQIEHLKLQGIEAVAGGSTVLEYANAHNIPGCLIESSKSDISRALDEAVRIVEIKRQEHKKNERLRNIMDYSFEGIISTDAEGIVTLVNRYAQEFFELSPSRRYTFQELFEGIDYKEIQSGRPMSEELIRIKGVLLTVNAVPVLSGPEPAGIVATFQKAAVIQEIEGKIRNKTHEKGFFTKYSFEDIIYQCSEMEEIVRTARRYSSVSSNILILGETGTGKEMFAQSIHNASARRDGPFVAVNCAALPENLLESELFGYVDGAFTGAAKGGKAGLFELAHKGTIFLDEISDISSKIQGRLLRVIQEREIIRLGHDRVTSIDVRVIAASNKNLISKVEAGEFRNDLLYRLDVLRLEIPPLRSRKSDCLILADYIIKKHDFGFCYPLKSISPKGASALLQYTWPGNIRELRNFCERLCVLCDTATAGPDLVKKMLLTKNYDEHLDESSSSLSLTVSNAEKQMICTALKAASGSRKQAATLLGWSKSTLWRKMKEYNIE
ncbi:sigma 54-interacting transcriptional regulator [Clostridium sp. AM58-1XD]|uniref:sigma 54-interacting transcriptional regulator n=1 Tax=Clostridium sp. AM58-1XD TaxID=2292307 RepID=UPI000E4CF3B2|nr:sigma 54-interacting transcriptional regulator [Clostridium sp. AM58-1XD]RGY97609.1 AAA family ATPase [Clostridium sp. AM58-1XD]